MQLLNRAPHANLSDRLMAVPSVEAVGVDAVGWQCILDLHDCRATRIDDVDWVRDVLLEAAERAEATVITDRFHHFSPYGISGVVVISESHLAIHTWPERRYAAVDVFTCSPKLNMRAAIDYLIASFDSAHPRMAFVQRGGPELSFGESEDGLRR